MSKNPLRPRKNPVVIVLLALALLAAACGGDDDGGDAVDQTTTTEAPETTEAPTTTEAPETTEAPAEEEEEETTTTTAAPTTTTEAPVVLTASHRGVTAESIKVGVPFSDVTFIGWEPSHEAAKIWQVAADTINSQGGVLGRMIEIVTIGVSPVDAVAQEAACVELTEDEEVFVAMGVIRNEIPLCYTVLHDTITINTYQTLPEIFEQSVAPMIGFEPLAERAVEAQLATLIDSGHLEGSKVALSATPTTIELAETMSQILGDAGIDVVSVTNFQSPSSDQFAIDNEMDVNFERWRSEGTDAVVAVPGASVPTTGVLSRNGWDGAYVITDAPGTDLGLLEGFGYGAEALVGSIAIVAADEADLYEAGQAGVRECVDTFDNAFDDDPPVELRPEDLRTGVVGLIVRSCQALELFKAISELAGPDLTNESFEAAADEIGAFTVTGVLGGSLGPGKRDYIDAGTALFVFDEELQRFVLG